MRLCLLAPGKKQGSVVCCSVDYSKVPLEGTADVPCCWADATRTSGCLMGLHTWLKLSRSTAEDGRVKKMGLETNSAPSAFSARARLLATHLPSPSPCGAVPVLCLGGRPRSRLWQHLQHWCLAARPFPQSVVQVYSWTFKWDRLLLIIWELIWHREWWYQLETSHESLFFPPFLPTGSLRSVSLIGECCYKTC